MARPRPIHIVDQEGNLHILPLIVDGYADPATDEDIAALEHGLTNPYLLRGIDDPGGVPEGEVAPRRHGLMIRGNNSYRVVERFPVQDNSDEDEIP